MRLESAAIVFASVALSSGSQVLLKSGMTAENVQGAVKTGDIGDVIVAIATSPPVIAGFFCFGLSLVLWLFILSRLPLSSAYPFVALGILVTVAAGSLLFSEPINLAKGIGVFLIIGGVILVGVGG
jgi:multidrug transporter EmrE-like cation transporter